MSSVAPLKPMPGWSNFTPMVILPESASSFIAVPSSKLVGRVVDHLDVGAARASSSPASPQAARLRASPATAMAALVRMNRILLSLVW